MSLLLVESTIPPATERRDHLDAIAGAATAAGADFVEAQVTGDDQVFAIVDLLQTPRQGVLDALADAGVQVTDSADVRLVGADRSEERRVGKEGKQRRYTNVAT